MPIEVTINIESNVSVAEQELKRVLAQWAEVTGGEMVNLTHRPGPRAGGRGTSVDTGRLRNSMDHAAEDDNKTIYVGTNVEYAEFVEEGVSGIDYGLGKGVGVHMLRNAVVDVKNYAEEALHELLESGGEN